MKLDAGMRRETSLGSRDHEEGLAIFSPVNWYWDSRKGVSL
jgi:hypothetical protein